MHSALFRPVAALVLLCVGAAAPTPATLPHVAQALAQDDALKIVAFGSSSTQGVGASSQQATYPAQLEADLRILLPHRPVVVENRGIGGEDAEDMMRRLPSILAEHPALIVWQTGTNDPLRDLPLDRFVALTRSGIAAIRASGADVMLIEPQDCKVFRNKPGALAYRDALRAIAQELSVPLVRRYDLMQSWVARRMVTPDGLQSGDGLHMGDAGYALLGRAVADEIIARCAELTAVAGK